jgi:hypothetical protein
LFLFSLPGAGQSFFEFYQDGMKFAEKDSFDAAIVCFENAIRLRSADEQQARAYGMRFMEYYPNRELGIIYYKRKDLDLAQQYLSMSIQGEPSDRAREYLLQIGQIKYDRSLLALDDEAPEIDIFSPAMLNNRIFEPVANQVSQVVIVGKVLDPGGVFEVMVNDQMALVASSGDFKAQVSLKVGYNDIFVKATDISRNSAIRTFFIFREDTVISEIASLGDGGKYYGLIIGVSTYADPQITDLDDYPLNDAEKLAGILTERYTFQKENTLVLKNPNRTNIQRVFDDLSKTITDKDNLLIFYAGHGHYDAETELGYWLPADAERNYTSNWIYNDVLVANLKRIRARHILLISDACFSGSIFKTRSAMEDAPMAYQKKYELKSRKAITSGVLQTVPNQSVFFRYLSDRLYSNQYKYFSASQLFQDIEIPVGNNSPNNPQFGVIRNVGDEGGDFIFILR